MKKKTLLITTAITSTLIVSFGVSGYLYVNQTNKQLSTYALPNTTFETINLENKTKSDIKSIISEEKKKYDERVITITINDKSYTTTWAELGVQYDGLDTAEQIFSNQTKGDFKDKIATKKAAEEGTYKQSFKLVPKANQEKIQSYVDAQYSDILSKPKNATIAYTNGKFQVVPGKDGSTVDKKLLVEQITNSINELKENPSIEAPVMAVQPEQTTEMMRQVNLNNVISQYRSSFSNRAEASIFNASLGAKYLDGVLLAPGEEFSFIQKVGKSTSDRGFVESAVYQNGEVATGVGGGICQVSSTLYNAALLADLDITERRNHSRPVGYVPLGLDATVSDYAPDLRFKNNTGNYIFIRSYSTGKELVVDIHGTPTGKSVEVYSKVDVKTDSMIKASAYQKVIQDGKVIRDKKISTSTYKVG